VPEPRRSRVSKARGERNADSQTCEDQQQHDREADLQIGQWRIGFAGLDFHGHPDVVVAQPAPCADHLVPQIVLVGLQQQAFAPFAAPRHSLFRQQAQCFVLAAGHGQTRRQTLRAHRRGMAAGRQEPAFGIEGQGFAAEARPPDFEQRGKPLVDRRPQGQHRRDPGVQLADGHGNPGATDLPGASGAWCAVGPHEGGPALQYRCQVREKVGRNAAPCTLHLARGEDPAARVDDQHGGDADPRRLAEDAVDHLLPVAHTPGGKADDPRRQFRLGRQLFRFVTPFRDPLLQGSDLSVEQGLHAGGSDLAQRIADSAVGPHADTEQGHQQQQEDDAGSIERDVHGSAV
jgi:hypothetical protein